MNAGGQSSLGELSRVRMGSSCATAGGRNSGNASRAAAPTPIAPIAMTARVASMVNLRFSGLS